VSGPLLDAAFDIPSQPGEGTTVVVEAGI